MTEQHNTGGAAAAVTAVVTTTQADAAVLAGARTEGATAERERMAAILGCEEAQGRAEQAQHLATKTSVSVADAKGILAASPKAQARSPLDAAMASGGPDVGGGDGEQTAHAKPVISSADIYARRAAAIRH